MNSINQSRQNLFIGTGDFNVEISTPTQGNVDLEHRVVKSKKTLADLTNMIEI
jgi:hypothetical protein